MITVLREEIGRAQGVTQGADNKASVLLAVLAFAAPLAAHVHGACAVAGWGLLSAAAALLMAVVIPRLHGPNHGWFGAYARLRPEELLARVLDTYEDPPSLAVQLAQVSRIALLKHRLIQAALLTMGLAAVAFALAAMTGGGGLS